MISLEGWLEQITYHSPQTHYTVARMQTGPGSRPVTIVGHLPGAAAGQGVRINGKWVTHPRYGEQFRFENAEITRPATVSGIRQYLESGVIQGVGPATAKKIISAFGADTFEVLDDAPFRLAEIEGIGDASASAIARQWQRHRAISEIMNFLQKHGIKAAYAARIHQAYGEAAMDILTHDPYQLAEELPAAGFAIAEAIAANTDVQADQTRRAAACIRHLLHEATASGHVFLPEDRLRQRLDQGYEIDWEAIDDGLEQLVEDGEVIIEAAGDENGRRVYPAALHQAEHGIAGRLAAMMVVPVKTPVESPEAIAAYIEDRFAVRLSDEQRSALASVLSSRSAVITGGPGTGKTTLIQAVAEAFRMTGRRVCLAAPTGRAARRLSEVTARAAHTIHKLLGYHLETRTFEKDPENPVQADVLIIDEASMIDAELMHHLLRATRINARLILVGDVFQLPPVGPGNVLADIIEAGIIPVHHLTEIFRQAARSTIIRNAHHIRAGQQPELVAFSSEPGDQDFFMIKADDTQAAADAVVELCMHRLPEIYGLVPGKDIQVLTPIHKGVAGTLNLNRELQKAINPGTCGISGASHQFRAGDRVMHLKNNYAKEVFNGDIGNIIHIDPVRQVLTADFYGREVSYDTEELEELTLGYAISVHKSQGSEYPAVVLPMLTRHYIMLQRNLLYTAITRAKQLVILVGSPKAVNIALKNDNPGRRLSGLASRLRQGMEAPPE
ncbi:MAG: ATP-dependent RecD-like DNA helicase [Desulfosalsimonas sp.]